METHISWVILTGKYAYKIKKPVDFGFVDYSTLENRKHFCELELALNSRFSRELYLDVVTINGNEGAPRISGDGEVLEYAVMMQEFSQDQILSNYLEKHTLEHDQLDEFAETLSDFHTNTESTINTQTDYGDPVSIHNEALDNFSALRAFAKDSNRLSQLTKLQQWTEKRYESLHTEFQLRKEHGFIRNCHGDLHLGNMLVLNNQITCFDCIEFNESFRWIDTMSELAFLVMDMECKQLTGEANQVLNDYLSYSGNYQGLRVFNFYKVYRAMVRAKVNQPGMKGLESMDPGFDKARHTVDHYLDLAERYTSLSPMFLAITHGVSGSGKSYISRLIAKKLGAIHIRSDVERKRLFGIEPKESSSDKTHDNIYSATASSQTYDRLLELAESILGCAFSAIVDATFLSGKQRRRFQLLAEKVDIPFVIIECEATIDILKERIQSRNRTANDPSEADTDVMNQQLINDEALTDQEVQYAFRVNTYPNPDFDALHRLLGKKPNS